MSSPTASLTPASQQALAEAALVLQHAQGFVYLPLLVQSERAGALAMERLRPALKAELFRVPWPLPQAHTDDPAVAEQRVQADLQAVLSALDGATRRLPSGAVLLLDASSSVRQAVARRLPVFLNQRREDWRRQGQGLLLLWPQAERDALMQGAPDLWSVRAAAPWVEEQDAAAPMLPVPSAPTLDATRAATALSRTQQRQLQALQAVEHWADADLSAADVLALLAALRSSHQYGSGLALAERVLNAPEFAQQTPDWHATLFQELAILRSQIGDRSGALAPAQEAVNLYLLLAQANPAAHEPNLASSLHILAWSLSEAGDRAGALAPAQEAVNLYRHLAQANPVIYEHNLALSLNNLAVFLRATARWAGALALAQEALGIYRRLAQASPAGYESDLASCLDTLGVCLWETGDRAGALANAQESVDIHRRLAQGNPVAYEPGLALSLNNLAFRLSETGDWAGALVPGQESVDIRRRLAQANPAAYEPDLALSLNNLAIRLNETGDLTGALTSAQEALGMRRRLAQANPAAYEPDLAISLWTAMQCLSTADHRAAALELGRESLRLFASLAEQEPARFEPYQRAVQAELDQLEQA